MVLGGFRGGLELPAETMAHMFFRACQGTSIARGQMSPCIRKSSSRPSWNSKSTRGLGLDSESRASLSLTWRPEALVHPQLLDREGVASAFLCQQAPKSFAPCARCSLTFGTSVFQPPVCHVDHSEWELCFPTSNLDSFGAQRTSRFLKASECPRYARRWLPLRRDERPSGAVKQALFQRVFVVAGLLLCVCGL